MTPNQGSPFTMFSGEHLSVMLVITALTVGLPFLIKKIDSEKITRTIAVSIGIFLLFIKISEPFVRGDSWQNWQNELPLHLCDLAAILTGIMLINRSYFFYELTYFWGFGGALQAMMTPSIENGFPHFDFLYYFIGHGLIIIGVIYATVLFKYRPVLKSIWRAFVAVVCYAALVAPINWILGTNYMYLFGKPKVQSLYDYLGPWPWYLLSLIPVALLFFFLYYSPFWIADLVRKRRQRAS